MIVESYFHAIIIIFRDDDGITGKKQRCVEGMPVLLCTGEMGHGARQHFALGPDAQFGLKAGFVA
jgi:hypothetical protein